MSGANITRVNTAAQFQRLVDDKATNLILDALFVGAGSCISVFGIFTNAVNIVVYLKQGVKDSITVQFLSLSVSDWAFSALVLASSVSVLFGQVKQNLTVVDPFGLSYCLAQAREKAYSMSVVVIFLMSIERCFCVALPFTVKLVFRKSRTVKIIVCMAIIFVTLLIPEYITQGLVWAYDKKFNTTRLLFWYSKDRTGFDVFKNSILAGALPLLSGVTTTICALYMISAVKESNKFRQFGVPCRYPDSFAEKVETNKNGVRITAAKCSLSGKDTRLIRTVIAVDIIFIVCNIPKCIVLASSVIALYIPEFSIIVASKYQNVVSIIMTITYTFEAINGACTFLVYYTSSTKFRKTCMHIFCSFLTSS